METEEKNIPQNVGQTPKVNQSTSTTTSNATSEASLTTPEKNTLMAVLAYISILVIIPYLMAKDDEFVKFHIKQGLVLVVGMLIVWVLGQILMGIYLLLKIVEIAIITLSIIGIINVFQGNKKELPLVGQFAKNFSV